MYVSQAGSWDIFTKDMSINIAISEFCNDIAFSQVCRMLIPDLMKACEAIHLIPQDSSNPCRASFAAQLNPLVPKEVDYSLPLVLVGTCSITDCAMNAREYSVALAAIGSMQGISDAKYLIDYPLMMSSDRDLPSWRRNGCSKLFVFREMFARVPEPKSFVTDVAFSSAVGEFLIQRGTQESVGQALRRLADYYNGFPGMVPPKQLFPVLAITDEPMSGKTTIVERLPAISKSCGFAGDFRTALSNAIEIRLNMKNGCSWLPGRVGSIKDLDYGLSQAIAGVWLGVNPGLIPSLLAGGEPTRSWEVLERILHWSRREKGVPAGYPMAFFVSIDEVQVLDGIMVGCESLWAALLRLLANEANARLLPQRACVIVTFAGLLLWRILDTSQWTMHLIAKSGFDAVDLLRASDEGRDVFLRHLDRSMMRLAAEAIAASIGSLSTILAIADYLRSNPGLAKQSPHTAIKLLLGVTAGRSKLTSGNFPEILSAYLRRTKLGLDSALDGCKLSSLVALGALAIVPCVSDVTETPLFTIELTHQQLVGLARPGVESSSSGAWISSWEFLNLLPQQREEPRWRFGRSGPKALDHWTEGLVAATIIFSHNAGAWDSLTRLFFGCVQLAGDESLELDSWLIFVNLLSTRLNSESWPGGRSVENCLYFEKSGNPGLDMHFLARFWIPLLGELEGTVSLQIKMHSFDGKFDKKELLMTKQQFVALCQDDPGVTHLLVLVLIASGRPLADALALFTEDGWCPENGFVVGWPAEGNSSVFEFLRVGGWSLTRLRERDVIHREKIGEKRDA